jgi:hypothetical protein
MEQMCSAIRAYVPEAVRPIRRDMGLRAAPFILKPRHYRFSDTKDQRVMPI